MTCVNDDSSRFAQPMLVAELSANHDQDLDQAMELVDIAATCGWTHVKFQTYDAASLTIRSKHPSHRIEGVWGYETLYDLYLKACMPMEFHEPLFARARDKGIEPFTSVYDPKDIAFVESLGCSTYKVASFELTYDDLLEELAKTGKPIILSTGMANIEEIDHACDVITKSGASEITLLHCCSAYPAPFDAINLRAISELKSRFGFPVGFSDHTEGSSASIYAVAVGASVIEKHFTNDKQRQGPDHRFSAEPTTLKEIAEGIKSLIPALGTGRKKVTEAELENKERGRRSAFAIVDIEPHTVITRDYFRFIRPGPGIKANQRDQILGRTTKNKIYATNPILPEDLF